MTALIEFSAEAARELLAPRFLLLYAFVACALYVNLRGKVRHRFTRAVTDHGTFLAPYNTLMYAFSGVPTTPFLDVSLFPELKVLRDNWETIRDEARALYESGRVKAADGYNDLAFNSFYRTGWKRFYLKWYDDYLPSARELCPRTVALLEGIPSINAGMFALLGPGSHLVKHRDPFAGSLRYHLGLITPNSEKCRIYVDDIPYVWKDGEDVMFDETYIHRAVNETDQPRIILFCDVNRPLRFKPVEAMNRFFVEHCAKASATRNVEGEKIGVFNKIFNYLYRVRLAGKWLKARNKTLYYAVKYALGLLLVWLIFF